jgi:hypothetical protein
MTGECHHGMGIHTVSEQCGRIRGAELVEVPAAALCGSFTALASPAV